MGRSKQVRSLEAPTWIRFGPDPSKHGNRTSAGLLCCLDFLTPVGFKVGPPGIGLVPMLNWIGIWGIWKPGRGLELLVMVFGPVLSSFCAVAGCTVLQGSRVEPDLKQCGPPGSKVTLELLEVWPETCSLQTENECNIVNITSNC